MLEGDLALIPLSRVPHYGIIERGQEAKAR